MKKMGRSKSKMRPQENEDVDDERKEIEWKL